MFSVISDPSVPGSTVNTGLLFIESGVSHSDKCISAYEKLSLFEDASLLLKIWANNKEPLWFNHRYNFKWKNVLFFPFILNWQNQGLANDNIQFSWHFHSIQTCLESGLRTVRLFMSAGSLVTVCLPHQMPACKQVRIPPGMFGIKQPL